MSIGASRASKGQGEEAADESRLRPPVGLLAVEEQKVAVGGKVTSRTHGRFGLPAAELF